MLAFEGRTHTTDNRWQLVCNVCGATRDVRAKRLRAAVAAARRAKWFPIAHITAGYSDDPRYRTLEAKCTTCLRKGLTRA